MENNTKYQVTDSFNGEVIGEYRCHEDMLRGIRLYCVKKMMSKVNLVDQNFILLDVNETEIIYKNPIGYFPNKPKFLIKKIN